MTIIINLVSLAFLVFGIYFSSLATQVRKGSTVYHRATMGSCLAFLASMSLLFIGPMALPLGMLVFPAIIGVTAVGWAIVYFDKIVGR